MKRRMICLGLAMLAGPALAGNVTTTAVESAALGRALPYSIYVPDGAPRAGEAWPVLYLLHTYGGNEREWFGLGGIDKVLDKAIAAGTIAPMVVVTPGAGANWFVDNPDPGGAGALSTAIATDLVAAVEAAYPVAACRAGRAVGGASMGGNGALQIGLGHPETYAAIAGFSAAIGLPLTGPDLPRDNPNNYSIVFGSPFDAGRYNKWNPFTLALQAAKAKPNERPAVWLTIGSEDKLPWVSANFELYRQLRTSHIPVSLRISAGRHDWSFWESEIPLALQFVSTNLKSHCT
ncbi:MAG: alpha/beta hydrolase-fold protein [Devosia sp.]